MKTYVVLYVHWDTTSVEYAGHFKSNADKAYKKLAKNSREYQVWEDGKMKECK